MGPTCGLQRQSAYCLGLGIIPLPPFWAPLRQLCCPTPTSLSGTLLLFAELFKFSSSITSLREPSPNSLARSMLLSTASLQQV